MAVTAMCSGIGMHEAEDLPGGEPVVHAVLELPDGAHAPVCVCRLFTRELHIGHLQAVVKKLDTSGKGRVLICVNIGNLAPPDKRSGRSCATEAHCEMRKTCNR